MQKSYLNVINIETGEVKSPYKGLDPSAMRQLAFSGIHVIWPRVFPLLESMPERFGIIDFYLKYCHQCAFLGYEKKDLQLRPLIRQRHLLNKYK